MIKAIQVCGQRGGEEDFFLYLPPLLEYTSRHNPLLALCGDYWLNWMGGGLVRIWGETFHWNNVLSSLHLGPPKKYLCIQDVEMVDLEDCLHQKRLKGSVHPNDKHFLACLWWYLDDKLTYLFSVPRALKGEIAACLWNHFPPEVNVPCDISSKFSYCYWVSRTPFHAAAVMLFWKVLFMYACVHHKKMKYVTLVSGLLWWAF